MKLDNSMDVESIKCFLKKTMDRFYLDAKGEDIIAEVKINADEMLMRLNSTIVEYHVKKRMKDELGEFIAKNMTIEKYTTQYRTVFTGRICVMSLDKLKDIIEKSIISVLNDVVAFEKDMEPFFRKEKKR